MIIGICLPWMESQEENVALTIIQRDNTLSVDESLLMFLSHNKPKKIGGDYNSSERYDNFHSTIWINLYCFYCKWFMFDR
jgi:hypothetical protein